MINSYGHEDQSHSLPAILRGAFAAAYFYDAIESGYPTIFMKFKAKAFYK